MNKKASEKKPKNISNTASKRPQNGLKTTPKTFQNDPKTTSEPISEKTQFLSTSQGAKRLKKLR